LKCRARKRHFSSTARSETAGGMKIEVIT
jgi:hypothetical protein